MTKRMLIDATHEEETRVAVVDGNKLVNFDYESKFRKQLKGSIFLAKITRVEPSLQAAFVNFGGNRHGFLPFSEIHPDYFRIPISDREALLAEQQAEIEAALAEEEAEEEEAENGDLDEDEDVIDEINADAIDVEEENPAPKGRGRKKAPAKKAKDSENEESSENDETAPSKNEDEEKADSDDKDEKSEEGQGNRRRYRGRGRGRGRGGKNMAAHSRKVEIVGGDGVEGDRPIRPSLRKNYKIQEVIKRGQIMLIQVSREERGNKGAAVTTYMSLPGRYGVLMPNSPRGGGVSRKIANFKDRKRLREILAELNVPTGMSVIMRTAGVSRTKTEIKRDIDYLMRLWDSIRELTLKSTAPALIHEESNLIRRAIRDIYTRDIEEINVSGEEGYKTARDFMKMMVPSHVKRVKEYKDDQIPLFHRYQVESQINEIGNTNAVLPSGGYLVINPTEALVSIDVNSGRATRERHIEETALRTNLEAAEEVARQLRLRDLGGLVVIDFIDMEDRRNNRKVENKLKEALSTDRARIQIGRISSFGLLELSRQRLNPSLTEAQFEQCPHCKGAGNIRTTDSATIIALRALEEEGIRNRAGEVILKIPNSIALYILNQKRDMLADIERRYGFNLQIEVDNSLEPADFKIEPVKGTTPTQTEDEEETEEKKQTSEKGEEKGEKEGGRGGRRRGRRGGRRRNPRHAKAEQAETTVEEGDKKAEAKAEDKETAKEETAKEDKPQRGRKKAPSERKAENKSVADKAEKTKDAEEKKAAEKPKRSRKPAASKAKKEVKKEDKEEAQKSADEKAEKPKSEKPKKGTAKKAVTSEPSNDTAPTHKEYETVNKAPTEKKKGWWNRLTD